MPLLGKYLEPATTVGQLSTMRRWTLSNGVTSERHHWRHATTRLLSVNERFHVCRRHT